jgi:hypothetical protein
MKKIVFSLIATFALTLITFANDLKSESIKTNIFLKTFYTNGFNIGKSIETNSENTEIIVSEILSSENNIVNGYIAISKKTNELLYFVNYNRESKSLNTIDFLNNEKELIDLSEGLKFENFTKIDLIKEIEKVNLDPNIYQRRFWGKDCGEPYSLEPGSCYRNCCQYILWIENGCNPERC